MTLFQRISSLCAIISLFATPAAYLLLPTTAQADISSWQRGIDVTPNSPTDFSSSNFQQSMQNAKKIGVNDVALVVPYYQSNTSSTDIAAGYNTPTDTALAAGIDYIHSLGMQVTVKFLLQSNDGQWRANINPSDRATWFANYQSTLVHIAQIAQAHQAEMIIIGTEMVSMASSKINSSNTQNWVAMIQAVRKVYGGKLTYGANSNGNDAGDPFNDEKASIGFWSSLDYAGLSTYYNLSGDNSVSNLEAQWDFWNKNDLAGFEAQVGKPLLIAEVGYRSVTNAHQSPWDYNQGGGVDLTEQANDYQALLAYWNNYSYIAGVYFWQWNVDPNSGGSGDSGYTPQNKPAQQVMAQYFGTPPAPTEPSAAPMFSSSAAANPGSPAQGQSTILTASFKNVGGTLQNGVVDIEVYNQSNQQVFQQFYNNQTIQTQGTQAYNIAWTPSSSGTYRVALGVFAQGWAQNYHWNNDAADVTVGGSSTPPPQNPPPANPPPSGQTTEIWWPSSGSSVSGVQPFKAMVKNVPTSQYTMYWQVDTGALNVMNDNSQDYPHKEADVDLSNWTWRGSGPYVITFTSKDASGNVISQASTQITVTH